MTYDDWKCDDGATDACPHGNDPEDCDECADAEIEAEYEKADREYDYQREREMRNR